MNSFVIVYVEDNEYLRETIGALMEADGREVMLFADAESALRGISERNFNLLIADVSLPGLSGTALVRQVLQGKPFAWVVLCSGYDLSSELKELGPNVRHLQKPFEAEALEKLIAEASTSCP